MESEWVKNSLKNFGGAAQSRFQSCGERRVLSCQVPLQTVLSGKDELLLSDGPCAQLLLCRLCCTSPIPKPRHAVTRRRSGNREERNKGNRWNGGLQSMQSSCGLLYLAVFTCSVNSSIFDFDMAKGPSWYSSGRSSNLEAGIWDEGFGRMPFVHGKPGRKTFLWQIISAVWVSTDLRLKHSIRLRRNVYKATTLQMPESYSFLIYIPCL